MYQTSIKLLKIIEENGFNAYIVGGFVRDKCMNKKSSDVDICTNATPKDLKLIFKDIKLAKEQYGSITLIYNKIRFEITTFRQEKRYLDNRHPSKVKYINNLLDDLKRRDFTINTICIDANENTIDLLEGINDIENKKIKMIGNPRIRLKEDALRILRAIRFATILNFELDSDLKKYIKKYSNLLKKLSYNRKKEELDKIFTSQNVEYGIKLILELGLDKPLELSNLSKIKITTSHLGIWAQLNVLDKYAFSYNEKELINNIESLINKNILDNEILYKKGLYICTIVGEINNISKKEIVNKYEKLYIKSKKDIDITTQEICACLNKQPGSYLKKIYEDLEKKLINKQLINEKTLLINYINENY